MGMYLRDLPDGVNSYPECLAKASLIRTMMELVPAEYDDARMPDPVAELFRHPPPKNKWIPEVHSVAAHFALFDASGLRESTLIDMAKDLTTKMVQSPMYRILANFTSPQRLLSGAAKRWQALHLGLPLQIEVDKEAKRGTIEMQHEPHIWTSLAHDWTAASWEPLLRLSNAKNGTIQVSRSSPTGALFNVRWE